MAARKVMVHRGKRMEDGKRNEAPAGLDFPFSMVGSSTWIGADGVRVFVGYDSSLGIAGQQIAKSILSRIDDLMAYCDYVFGVKGKGGNVVVAAVGGNTDGTGGAYHYSCQFNSDSKGGSDWYVDMSASADMTFGLAMAEICESYMGLQSKGWNCGGSGGEGLSRFLAEIVSGGPSGALKAFESGPSWDGSNWIDKDQGTDQDYPSIGCSILYLWWMTALGYSPSQIVRAGCPSGTLASNYAALGNSAANAFSMFQQAVTKAGGATSDNPFKASTPPYPLPAPAPTPTPAPVPAPTPTPQPPPVPTPAPCPPGFDDVCTALEKVYAHKPLTLLEIKLVKARGDALIQSGYLK